MAWALICPGYSSSAEWHQSSSMVLKSNHVWMQSEEYSLTANLFPGFHKCFVFFKRELWNMEYYLVASDWIMSQRSNILSMFGVFRWLCIFFFRRMLVFTGKLATSVCLGWKKLLEAGVHDCRQEETSVISLASHPLIYEFLPTLFDNETLITQNIYFKCW